jgi:sulfur carrier protein ThiS
VTVLVHESPVPADAPVEADEARVLRLVAGG